MEKSSFEALSLWPGMVSTGLPFEMISEHKSPISFLLSNACTIPLFDRNSAF